MSPLRVLHVTPDLVPYGLENMIAGLVRTLDRAAFTPAVVSLYDESAGGLEPELRAHGVPLFHLGKRRGLDVRMFPRLMRAVRQFRPHILHTHNYVLRYAYPVALAAGIPAVVHTIHNVAEHEVDHAGRLLQSVAFRKGVTAVTIAGEVSASFRRTYGFAEAAMIPNGIDVSRYASPAVSRAAWRHAAGIAQDDFVYLSVARFSEQKDHETLLRAFAQGPARMVGARLALAGDGELRAAIERRVLALGLSGRVTFLGRRTDIPETLAAADVFVLASRWEGNPLSVMEAMAAGRPVVATNVGAIPELVRDGADGLLSRPGDAAALAHSMLQTGAFESMGRAAAARARERFDLPVMTRGYAELYGRVSRAQKTGRNLGEEHVVTERKVMLVVTALNLSGGAELQVMEMAVGLKQRGWDVEIVSLAEPEPLSPDLNANGIRVHSLGMRRGVADFTAVLRFRSLVRRSRPDVVHAHMTHANLLARVARALTPMPVLICTLHGYKMYSVKSNSSGMRELAHRLTDRFTDMTTVVCQAAAERYARVKVAPAEKLMFMPNGIRTASFGPDSAARETERRNLNLGDGFVWLAAGRLEMVKDYDTMLRGFAAALDANGRQTLLIAGEGSLRQTLERTTEELGIASNVRFLGFRGDVSHLMRAADAFVMSSIFEGMPLALLEAGASELPVVATRVGGNAETMLEGRSGFLVPASDPVQLGLAMGRLAAMPTEERLAMGRTGGEYVRANYSLDGILDRWEELYAHLMAQPVTDTSMSLRDAAQAEEAM